MKYAVSFACATVLALAAAAAGASDRPVSSGPRIASPGVPAAGAAAGMPSVGMAEVTEAAIRATGAELGAAPVKPFAGPMNGDPEVILNYDTRMTLKTSLYPNRAVVLITRNGAHHCTGWMISRNTVATAGHCVHTGGSGGAFFDRTTLRVWPGRDGTTAPYGSCGVVRLHTVLGWSRNGNRDFDYGAMRLNCNIGDTTGWFGIYELAAALNEPAVITGYPGDKPQTQWVDADKVREVTTRQIRYRMDTVGGNSGSPIWSDRDNALATTGVWAYGIHTFGDTANNRNGGTRLVAPVITNFTNWINQP